MLNNGFLAKSANIKELVDEADGMNILVDRKDVHATRVMSNSFGFGGTNCCLIFDKYSAWASVLKGELLAEQQCNIWPIKGYFMNYELIRLSAKDFQ